ncbi:MAG: (2Fe-2S)-binding protein [Bdellovibrionota bacterium]
MTDHPLFDPAERTICFCHYVKAKEIVEAIRTGSRTLQDIQADTLASTGCGGCMADVLEILEAELESEKQP